MEDKINNIKNYIILGLVLLCGILFMIKGCKPTPSKTEYIDNVVAEHTYDTVYQKDTVVEFKTIYYPKVETITKIDYKVDSNLCKYERTYNDTVTNLQLDIYDKSKVIGMLQSHDISYHLKVPIIIKDSVVVTKTVVQPTKYGIYALGEVGGNLNTLNASVGGALKIKNKLLILKYGLLDHTYQVGFGIKLWEK